MTNRINRLKLYRVANYKNFFSHHDFFKIKFFSVIYRKQPKPHFVVSALAPPPGCNLISVPRLRLHNPSANPKIFVKIRSRILGFEPELLDPYPILEMHIEILRSLECGRKIIELFNSAILSVQIELTDNCFCCG